MKPLSDYLKFSGDNEEWIESLELKALLIPEEEQIYSSFFFGKDGIQVSVSVINNHKNYKDKIVLRATLAPLFSCRRDLTVAQFEKFILDSAPSILKLFFGDLRFGDPIRHNGNYVTRSYEAVIE